MILPEAMKTDFNLEVQNVDYSQSVVALRQLCYDELHYFVILLLLLWIQIACLRAAAFNGI